MKKRICIFAGCFLFSLTLIWGILFTTDCIRCSHLKKPLFVIGISDTLASDGGSGTYQGLGYTVDVEGHLSAEYGYVVESVELSILGKVVAAAIS